MRLLFFAAALAAAAIPSRAGICYSDGICKTRCCERSGLDAPCWCSSCCVAKSDVPDDRATIYWNAKRAVFVYRHRVEFYELKGAKPALLADDGSAKALHDEAAAWGRPALAGADGKPADRKPKKVMRLTEGIYPFTPRKSRAEAFLVCSSPEWGVSKTAEKTAGFCGGLALDGRELFRLEPEKEAGLLLEPVGLSADAGEALFAITKKKESGAREIVAYRLWSKGRPAETLEADGKRAKTLVDKYEGPFVLPSQQRGSDGH